MKVTLIYLILILFALTSCKSNKDVNISNTDNSKPTAEQPKENKKFVIDATKDAEYVVDTYANGLYAIKAAELAENKTQNADVKACAAKITKTHQKLIDAINTLASAKKISLPSELSMAQRGKLKNLNEIDPGSLDKKFIQEMETEHKTDIALLEKISKESEDNEISTLAITSLTALKSQYDEVVTIKERLDL